MTLPPLSVLSLIRQLRDRCGFLFEPGGIPLVSEVVVPPSLRLWLPWIYSAISRSRTTKAFHISTGCSFRHRRIKIILLYLEKAEARADEPYILAGEDVAGLQLTILSFFKRLGDSGAERALRDASEQQQSAVRLFIQPEYLGSNFKKTRSLIEKIRIDSNWPALKAEETALASPIE